MKPNDSETHDVLKAALKADHLHAPGCCSHQRQRYVRKRTRVVRDNYVPWQNIEKGKKKEKERQKELMIEV